MVKGRRKIPKWLEENQPHPTKVPSHQVDPESYMRSNPAWRISMLEVQDPYGWHCVDENVLHDIRKKLRDFESMTWNEILVRDKRRNHSIPRNQLSAEAQKRLKDLNQDDIDELVSLRLTGENRVWGIWDKGILKLLWWDPNHQVCPSLLKHT